MEIKVEHIGRTVSYAGNAPFTIEGFERHGTMLFMYGTGEHSGVRPSTPLHPGKVYYAINGRDVEHFHLIEPDGFDFSRFGCQEKNVRDLMDYLDKRCQKVKS